MNPLSAIQMGAVMFVLGLVAEFVWYCCFANCGPRTQRWSAHAVQLVRVFFMLAVLHWGWHGLEQLRDPVSGWTGHLMVFGFIFLAELAPFHKVWYIQGENSLDRSYTHAKYLYRLPYEIRWYLRRNSIANACLFAVAIGEVNDHSHRTSIHNELAFPILMCALTLYPLLALVRWFFVFYEPPLWNKPMLFSTAPRVEPLPPGHPDPRSVEEYLNQLPPRRPK